MTAKLENTYFYVLIPTIVWYPKEKDLYIAWLNKQIAIESNKDIFK